MKFNVNTYSEPRFANKDRHPFDEIDWENRYCGTNEDTEKVEIECPKHWSQRACDVVASRYLRRGNIPNWEGLERGNIPPIYEETGNRETSIKHVIHRLAYFLAQHSHIKDKDNYYLDICYLLLHQIIGFNTPAWINGGLYDVYGIEGAERTRYWYDKASEKVVELNREQIRPGMAACYLTGVEDHLIGSGGMYDYITTEMKVFTVGSGDGANISKIRGKGEPITGGGVAEGLKPFLKIPDASAAYIKSGGVSRRAARMLVCDDDHPDVKFFAQWKASEEDKAQAMAEGFLERRRAELEALNTPEKKMNKMLDAYWYELTDFNGEIYSTISGQQSNNSIRCSDKFIRAVKKDGNWNLTWRTNPKHKETIKAKELWDIMCESAWKTGDPGIMYGDTMNRWNTVPHYGEIVTTNPCSEITQPNYTSCNLCTINLVKFEEQFEQEKFEDFIDTSKIIILSLETIAESCSHPTAKHAKVTSDLRPLGANIGNLGAYLMRQGLAYDSDAGRRRAAIIAALFNASCWEASKELGSVLGAYPAYNKRNHLEIISMHQEFASRVWDRRRTDFEAKMAETAEFMYSEMEDCYAFRNDAVTCAVPTGTIGFVLDYDTNGIEPDFALVKQKKLSDGGTMHIVNESIPVALHNLGYSADEVTNMTKRIFEERTVVGIVRPEEEAIFDCAMKCSEGRFIAVEGHIKMMGALQPHMSMAMSKTINMPAESTVEDISDAYMLGWELGLKSMAIYRDGSKMSQPLNTTLKKKSTKNDDYSEAITALREALK